METDFYGQHAEADASHWWFKGRQHIVESVLTQSVHGPQTILDFGCGPGGMYRALERFGQVTGVDPSSEAIRLCRARGLEEVRVVDPTAPLPFEAGQFSLVTALDVIEHIEEDCRALAELRRVTSPNGRLLVTVPAFPALWGDQDVVSHHVRRYTRRSLQESLEAAGWSIARLSFFNTFLFPAIAAVRVGRRLFRDPEPRSDLSLTPGALTPLLTGLMRIEALLLRRWNLPVGVSLIALARPQSSGGPAGD